MKRVKVIIPTNQSFLRDWYSWTHGRVSRHFKRNKERVIDTAQNVRLRLLSKDFIGRWFFKHLTEDLITREQAEKILGGIRIAFAGSIHPVVGDRSDPESLWRVSDILQFAKFNYDRYYYSIQNHTIDSDRMIRLLGYPESHTAYCNRYIAKVEFVLLNTLSMIAQGKKIVYHVIEVELVCMVKGFL